MHFWESLSESELDQRLRHLGESGFSFTALHSHWGDWERLDAGGRIAPHGAEQLARYIRIASRHGMSHIQAIASGPYATQKVAYGGTIPYSRYLEMGFTTEQFMLPGAAFDEYYHQYLTDLALLLRDETGLFGYTAAGEGDHFVGPARTNDTMHTVQSIDQNHAFLAETVNMMTKLPQTLNRGFDEDRFGARTYFIGNHYLPEADIGVLFKLLHMSDMYLAEGSWPPMPSYVRFHYDVLRDGNGSSKCWTGTEHFRRRLRDTLYLGLVNLLPVINAWDEAFTEDEHIIFREICALIDWHQSFAIPKLTIAVTDLSADLEDPAYGSLIQHEIALSRLGIAYRFVQRGERTTGSPYLLDGTALPEVLRYRSEGGVIPDELSKTVPLLVSPGYGTNHVVSVDGLTTLAYIYNTTRHDRQYYWLGGHNHRAPIPAPLSVSVDLHMERTLRLRLYDLGTRRLIMDKAFHRSETLHLGETDSDFFCVVTPT